MTVREAGPEAARLAHDRRRLGAYARAADKRSAELAQLNAELARVSAEKSRLVAIVSRGARPLTVIMGNAQLLQREDLEPKLQRRLQQIQVASQQQMHPVNNILDRSSIEASHQLAVEQVDIADLVEDYSSLYSDRRPGNANDTTNS